MHVNNVGAHLALWEAQGSFHNSMFARWGVTTLLCLVHSRYHESPCTPLIASRLKRVNESLYELSDRPHIVFQGRPEDLSSQQGSSAETYPLGVVHMEGAVT
jgi:hypothetical protein